jgi:hypothetical protein
MEGTDEKMSWLVFSSRHSVPGDALAAAGERGALSDLLFDPVNPVIQSEILFSDSSAARATSGSGREIIFYDFYGPSPNGDGVAQKDYRLSGSCRKRHAQISVMPVCEHMNKNHFVMRKTLHISLKLI